MRAFYNDKKDIVSQALDGLIASSGGRLRRFSSDSHARVVVRADWDKSKVAIISGGGSGHEPAHAGLIGEGMLTAAVCGEVYTSPSVDAVLSAILEVSGAKGCLLVIKNYTGDRLNFGLAAEKAKALGHKVEMVIVGDDVAIDGAPQPRGIAGTIFVHKVAGFMSENGESLDAIVTAVNALIPNIKTLGVARDTCTVPGSEKQSRIGDDEVEVGLGIHGEPGVDVKAFDSAANLVKDFADRLSAHVDTSKRHIAFFNNLGGLNGLECAILFNEFMQTDLAKSAAHTIGPDAIMTALDMPGFSITMVELDSAYEDALLSPASCAAWPVVNKVTDAKPIIEPELPSENTAAPSNDPAVRKIIESIIVTCKAMENDLNELDAKVGDGDTGTTFAAAARTVDERLNQLPLADGAALFAMLSDIKGKLMGGSSGVLFAILFANAADSFKQNDDWAKALSDGLDAMQKYGGAAPGDRTMIDALRPAFDALTRGASMNEAAKAAREGADATAKMLSAKAGRSSYLEARSLDGFADPGAEGIARIFEALES